METHCRERYLTSQIHLICSMNLEISTKTFSEQSSSDVLFGCFPNFRRAQGTCTCRSSYHVLYLILIAFLNIGVFLNIPTCIRKTVPHPKDFFPSLLYRSISAYKKSANFEEKILISLQKSNPTQ